MLYAAKKTVRSEKGFTLIELMVVVAIIAVLVSIAIPSFINATTNAKQKTCQANLRGIDGAIQIYYAEKGIYPADVASLVGGSFLKSTPTEPFGASYTINATTHIAVCNASPAHTY